MHRNERSYNMELYRLKHLTHLYDALRTEIAEYYGDEAAWQHEAYLNYAGEIYK